MSIFEKIQQTRQEFRKSPDQTIGFTILTLLVGELETSTKRDGSSVTDEKVVAAIKKLIKSNEETIRLSQNPQKFVEENKVLKSFLPEEMSEEQLRVTLTSVGFSTIGEAMKFLNSNFAGKFDKGLASKVAKELL